MLDCRHCGEYLTGEAERYGARCPRCREPLYERPDAVRRQRDGQEAQGGGTCAVHPGNPAVGPCKRCGTFMCGLCRSRWTDRTLCVACVDRIMSGGGDDPGKEQAAHRRQALLGVILGLTGWVLAMPLLVARGVSSTREVMVALLLIALMSLIPTLFGVGQSAAAIRTRGNRMIMATIGLALSGLQVGTVMGMVLLVIWKH
jgi:hypothetical protein